MGEIKKLKVACKFCGVTDSVMWHKCCPAHCTEQGDDVVCEECAISMHRICLMQGCNQIGTESRAVQFGIFDELGNFRRYTDNERIVFLCKKHDGVIVLLEPQY